jgi:plasmid maintenance system killer protein
MDKTHHTTTVSRNVGSTLRLRINGPWRIHFEFADGNAHEVNIVDPH